MEGFPLLLVILVPPLAVIWLGSTLWLKSERTRERRVFGAALSALGMAQLIVMFVSFGQCTPFDSDPCHGSSWTDWPAALSLWGLCVVALLGTLFWLGIRSLRAPSGTDKALDRAG